MNEPSETSLWQIEPDELPPNSLMERDSELGKLSESAWFRLFCTIQPHPMKANSTKRPVLLLAALLLGNLAWAWVWLMTSAATFSWPTMEWVATLDMTIATFVILVWSVPHFILVLPLGITGPLLDAHKRRTDAMQDLYFIDRDSKAIAYAWLGYYVGRARHGKWTSSLKLMSICCVLLLIIGWRIYWLEKRHYEFLLALLPSLMLFGILLGLGLCHDSVVLQLAAKGRPWRAQRRSDPVGNLFGVLLRFLFGMLRLAWRLFLAGGLVILAGIIAKEFDLDDLVDGQKEYYAPLLLSLGLVVGLLLGAGYAWRARRNHAANLETVALRAQMFLESAFGEPQERTASRRKLLRREWGSQFRAHPFKVIFWRAPWVLARFCFYVWLLAYALAATRIDGGYISHFIFLYDAKSYDYRWSQYITCLPEIFTIVKWESRGVYVDTNYHGPGRRNVRINLMENRDDFVDDLENWIDESASFQLEIHHQFPSNGDYQPLLSDVRLLSRLTFLNLDASSTPLPAGWNAGVDFTKFSRLDEMALSGLTFDRAMVLPVSLKHLVLIKCSGIQFVQRSLPSDGLSRLGFQDMPLDEITGFFLENPQPIKGLSLGRITSLDDLTSLGFLTDLRRLSIGNCLLLSLKGIEKFEKLNSLSISGCSSLPNEELLALASLKEIETLRFKDWTVLQVPYSHSPNYEPYGDLNEDILDEAEWMEKQIHWEKTLQNALEQMNQRF